MHDDLTVNTQYPFFVRKYMKSKEIFLLANNELRNWRWMLICMSEVSTSFFSCKQEQLLCTYTEVNTSSLGYMYSMLLKEIIAR